jgi:hypothetical protein
MVPLPELGYAHARYAESLAEFGRPRRLDRSGAWILERSIPGSAFKDAMGCYPIFCCRDWSALRRDTEQLSDLVSLTHVTDPFGEYDLSLLRECFPDLATPFKHHYVTDLTRKPETFVSEHRRLQRTALESASRQFQIDTTQKQPQLATHQQVA